jgi:hypothetical protein
MADIIDFLGEVVFDFLVSVVFDGLARRAVPSDAEDSN